MFIDYQESIIKKFLIHYANKYGYELQDIDLFQWREYKQKFPKTYIKAQGRYDGKYFKCLIDPVKAFDNDMYDEMFRDMKYRDERGWLVDED